VFRNRLGKGEPIQMKVKEEGNVQAYKLPVGNLSGIKKDINLTINPEVDVTLILMAVMCLVSRDEIEVSLK